VVLVVLFCPGCLAGGCVGGGTVVVVETGTGAVVTVVLLAVARVPTGPAVAAVPTVATAVPIVKRQVIAAMPE